MTRQFLLAFLVIVMGVTFYQYKNFNAITEDLSCSTLPILNVTDQSVVGGECFFRENFRTAQAQFLELAKV
jgi:hypothetical protein